MSEELCYASARELARGYRRRDFSPVEVVEAVIARATRAQTALNLFVFTRFDEARAEATIAEARLMRGESRGPLDGVPLAVKDNLATLGHKMTNGSFAMANFEPTVDAVSWARLKAAGAILLGKTATPEFAHKVLTDSPMYGVTRSPWSQEHTPGGSSGGATAAVACGLGPIGLGTDGGGSIRCPASCSNVLGIKATLGRIPFESIPDGFANYAFTGPFARDADDLALALALMSGPLDADPHTIGITAMPVPPPRGDIALRKPRIGWIQDFGGRRCDAEVAGLTRAAIDRMASEGAVVEALDDPIFADVFDYYVVIATTAHAARLAAAYEQLGERMSASLRASVEQGRRYSAAEWQRASDRRTALFRRVQQILERFDLIATPTMNTPPKRIDEGGAINTPMYADWACALYPFNLTGHPALSMPVGFTASGLPVGLQLVGRWHDEARLIDVAAWHGHRDASATRRPSL
jgi:aspartyl-tRNA(Asn)/glutamyl-tRNA(Gln) amidotransferase subunit A